MKKRMEVLDSLRGFSLLGILIANMLYFQYGTITKEEIEPSTWWDQAAFYFTKIVVEASVYPIFGFLFGYGIILFVGSLEKRELNARGPLWRRAIGLVVLGALHIAFVWDGDILLTYGAALIMIILFFLKRQVKTWLVWSGILAGLMLPSMFYKENLLALLAEEADKAAVIFSSGTYLEVMQHRIGLGDDEFGLIFWIVGLAIGFILVAVMAFFAVGSFILLGMAAAKVDLFNDIEQKQRLLKRVTWLVPVGLLCKAFLVWEHPVGTLIYGFGTYALAIGYIALFTLLFIKLKDHKIMHRFASVGRLSLSNYLLQSIICTTIFYGYGFGYFGKLGVALGLVLALIVYGLQLVGSRLYVQRFSIGPVEWLLRKFVYLGKAK
ncbi:DUF418 domain-containing protein [Solibacillus sp. MA9]|uniref:DUF418 domain-containing protein n=1 Tax=Solibacillus palustris TaxID=2908203 RepID=A0ABS9UHJ4_9BACL|nr:DUF418 domain-containing protein [Solibacillus sp. MA9]MCH7323834.1 DUF418 domain-containing protein [Solibacillus sp. MA9]